MIDHERLLIGGAWTAPRGTGRRAVDNPATEERIGSVPEGTAEDVDAAVAAARAAQAPWAALTRAERATHLDRLHGVLSDRADEIAELIALDVGAPVKIARRVQTDLPLSVLRATIALLEGPEQERRIGNSLIVREPIGVVAAITPWNYPLQQTIAKVAGALAAGCTVVHKPAELAPLSAFALAQAILDAELPGGVYNLVSGPGATVGDRLAGHAGVDLVSFTGSTAVGSTIAARAAETVTPVSLELGGKSANVILDDADLEKAVRVGVGNCFLNSGQTCSAWTRMLVPRARLAEAEALAAAAAERMTLGDPFDPQTRLGPLISERQRDAVRRHVELALEQGARVVTGGAAPPDGVERGWFARPTVLSDVRPEMAIAREEVFGPVLALLAYDDEAEAIRIANDCEYGLSGAVWSADEQRAVRVARALHTGQVDVNGAAFNPAAPFGGVKRSGHGRELGPFGVEEFTTLKSIQL